MIDAAILPAPLIRLEQVGKEYLMGQNRVVALHGINLSIDPGEMMAITGASGSGKSTLMNIIGCLDIPTGGHYFLEGIPVDRLSKNQLADLRNRKLGFVFQGFNLLARTSAVENVELPLLYDRSGRERNTLGLAARALALVGLGDRIHHRPSELSGGQQQRVAIARALVTEPAVLLADEPTGNLDTRTSVQIMALFQQLNDRGITIILVTHEPDIAQFAKRIVEMRDGQIVQDRAVVGRERADRERPSARADRRATV